MCSRTCYLLMLRFNAHTFNSKSLYHLLISPAIPTPPSLLSLLHFPPPPSLLFSILLKVFFEFRIGTEGVLGKGGGVRRDYLQNRVLKKQTDKNINELIRLQVVIGAPKTGKTGFIENIAQTGSSYTIYKGIKSIQLTC